MQTFTELLPATKSEPKGQAIEWTGTGEGFPAAGVLVIKGKRVYTTYAVCEFKADWAGRAFMFDKVTEGSDKTEERYACFVGERKKQCECKGFTYAGNCKHVASVVALIANGQV